MAIAFNHTIVDTHNSRESACFLTELFGLPDPEPLAHFQVVTLSNGVSLDYDDIPKNKPIHRRHYAFLVSDSDFDAIYVRITSRRLDHWADPRWEQPGEINHRNGGRGVYFRDPSGHNMEIFTQP